jgi:hypothetical protein
VCAEAEVEEKTVFRFDELSDEAKEQARNDWRTSGHHDQWWDHIHEGAITIAQHMDIEIDRPTLGGHIRTSIYFSGFSSQGDGACYAGDYRYQPGCLQAITEHAPEDAELHRIARELTAIQITARLRLKTTLTAKIRTEGTYCHSGTMKAEVKLASDSSWPFDINVPDDLETRMLNAFRAFADWIYGQLKAEDEYLNSDEYIDECLAEHEFDEDGGML